MHVKKISTRANFLEFRIRRHWAPKIKSLESIRSTSARSSGDHKRKILEREWGRAKLWDNIIIKYCIRSYKTNFFFEIEVILVQVLQYSIWMLNSGFDLEGLVINSTKLLFNQILRHSLNYLLYGNICLSLINYYYIKLYNYNSLEQLYIFI